MFNPSLGPPRLQSALHTVLREKMAGVLGWPLTAEVYRVWSFTSTVPLVPSLCSGQMWGQLLNLETYFNNQLNAQFLYSITICILHYNPWHVLSINMPIFRRTNCIITASGIVTLEVSERSYINTFTASVDLSRSNFSIARAPLFQLKSAT